MRCVGFGCRTLVTFAAQGVAAGADPLVMKSFVQQELIKRGFLWAGFHNLSAAHTADDVAALLAAYAEVLPLLRTALEQKNLAESLRGEPVEAVFRRRPTSTSSPSRRRPRPPRQDGNGARTT